MVDVGSLGFMITYLSIEDSGFRDVCFYVGTLLAFIAAVKNICTILGGRFAALYTMIQLTFIDMIEFLCILFIFVFLFHILQQGLWKTEPVHTLIPEHYQNGMGTFNQVY